MTVDRIADLPRVGNAVCLDLVNLVEPRVGEVERDHLQTFEDLVEWAAAGEVITDEQASTLLERAAERREAGVLAHRRAVALRETLHVVFAAIAAGDAAPHDALHDLVTVHADLVRRAGLAAKGAGYCWDWTGPWQELEVPVLGPVTASAIDLLRTGPLDRLKACPIEDGGCAWLFVDTSKNRSRRWCSMEDCGSRVKARRHYQRHRASSSTTH